MVMMNKTNPLTIPFKRTVQAGILNKVGGAFQPWLRIRVGSHRRLTGPFKETDVLKSGSKKPKGEESNRNDKV
jgi:hypothetical protein